MRLININGKILPQDTAVFPMNRAMNYGDGMFESIRLCNGELLFFEDHIERMLLAINALKINFPESYSAFFFHKQITDLLKASGVADNAMIRAGVYRAYGGLYEPTNNNAEYFIELKKLDSGYELNKQSYQIGIFEMVKKDSSAISFFKSMNALPYVMASIYKKEYALDDCFMINSDGNIVEATSSNIFWIEKRKIYTPPIADGCIDGVMRKNIISSLLINGYEFEEKSLPCNQLQSADEIFLTNVNWGIKSVSQFGSKQYQRIITEKIFELITL